MNSQVKFELITDLCEQSIGILDAIWHYNNDTKFNVTIDHLCKELSDISYIDSRLTELSSKLLVYKHAFRINVQRDHEKGSTALTIRTHVVDLWKIILFNINCIIQHMTIYELKNQNKLLKQRKAQLGKYIESLQHTITKKNNSIMYQRNKVKKLGSLLMSKERAVIFQPTHDYEVVQPVAVPITSFLSNWF